MFGLGKKTLENGCTLILDVGSGSVGMAIVKPVIGGSEPEIIWTHREFALMKDVSDSTGIVKIITTALVNAFLELGGEGLKTLKEYDAYLEITEIQAGIGAPWTHTITKNINYTDEHPFEVTEELVSGLIESAKQASLDEIRENGVNTQGLELITNKTINVKINGYNVHKVESVEGRQVELNHIIAFTEKNLMKAIKESRDKILPKAEITTNSFIYIFYHTLSHMHPDTSEVCLVDVTKEATEIGIVREGVLNYTTHTKYGSFTLAREIAALCNIPKEEAYIYLKGGEAMILGKLAKSKQDQLAAILSTYDLKISALFQETGDSLSVPKTIFMHSDRNTADFFRKHLGEGARLATNSDHSLHAITAKLFPDLSVNDTGVLLSAQYCQLEANADKEDYIHAQ